MNGCGPEGIFNPALFTDLYELTMAQAYDAEHIEDVAVFELAFRKMPQSRNYIVAAGLEDVLRGLDEFRFSANDFRYLHEQGFSPRFLDRLRRVRFTGEVYAMPEGTIVFPNEPLVQIVAPIIEAQLLETFVLNQIHFESVLTAKASRIIAAAEGRMIIDFGSRRSHGTEAALKAARATYLAGGEGTSNVLAGKVYDIPVFGTMAHSYIQAHENEYAAFEAFEALYPETTLLVDTYDTLGGIRNVVRLSRKLGSRFRVKAIRLDSGDLGTLSLESRKLLDDAGLHNVKIFASSGLDEYKIQALVQSGAPIDGFGVGTKLAVAEDAPALDMAYKLVEYAGKGCLKLSAKKVLYPGRKQVFRIHEDGRMLRDVIGRFDENLTGTPLLECVFHRGHPHHRPTLWESREHLRDQLERMPSEFRKLERAKMPYPVFFSDLLEADLAAVRAEITQRRVRL